LDVEPGNNVDIVPDDPFYWADLASESFDVVVSGQMLEHNPFFWITSAEIARVLVQGGLAALIAPSDGYPHRFPLDCWRFYPDSWLAICTYVGLDLLESHREIVSWRKTVPGTYWRDAMMIGRKPTFENAESRESFYRRIDAIVDTRVHAPQASTTPLNDKPAAQRYEETHTLPTWNVLSRPQHVADYLSQQLRRIKETRLPLTLRQRISKRDGRAALQRGEELMP
jgi:SAM-dependent methyltransferase